MRLDQSAKAVLLFLAALIILPACNAAAKPAKVEVVKQANGWQLQVDGEPYYINGAGGEGDLALLAKSGGNTIRTWGVGDDTQKRLDDAHRAGLKVVLGIWLGHERHGFDYDDEAKVREQFDKAKAAVLKYKDHPALLIWGVGNEMEGYERGDNRNIWKAVNDIAAMIKEIDPNHPTMTVTAEIGGERIKAMHEWCPAIDIVGINSYGGVQSLPKRYRAAGGTKPMLVTEFGPPGTWEQPKNGWGVPVELTSTQKADIYKTAYEMLRNDPICIGSMAFLWGNKQETTATWFGMLLPDGTKLAAVDAMTEAWTGKAPANLCPRIEALTLISSGVVDPGDLMTANLVAKDPEQSDIQVEWVLSSEAKDFVTGGDFRRDPPTHPEAILKADDRRVQLKAPAKPGRYRLYVYVRDGEGGAAAANVPVRVDDPKKAPNGKPANLPLIMHGDERKGKLLYIPSGYMGNHEAIVMDERSQTQPYAGKTCLEIKYNKIDGWGGVAWQTPANDWGDKPGGFDLSKADQLTFWARGAEGGEKVKFLYGLIGREKAHFDTDKQEMTVTLEKQWKRYSFDLSDRDLSHIKTGFGWVAAGQGRTLTFYLDDVAYISPDHSPERKVEHEPDHSESSDETN